MDYRDWGRGDLARHERRSADSWGDTGRDPLLGTGYLSSDLSATSDLSTASSLSAKDDDLRPVGRYRHDDIRPGQGRSDGYGSLDIDDDDGLVPSGPYAPTTPTYRTPSRRRGADPDDASRYIPDWASGTDTSRWSSSSSTGSTSLPTTQIGEDRTADTDRRGQGGGRHHREVDEPESDPLRSSRFTFRSDSEKAATGGRRRRRADDEPTARSGRFIDSKSWDTSGKRLVDEAEIAQWKRIPDPDRKRGGPSDIDRWWDRTSDPEEWARPARERLSRERLEQRLEQARLNRERSDDRVRPDDREASDRSEWTSRSRRGNRSHRDAGTDSDPGTDTSIFFLQDESTGAVFGDRDRDRDLRDRDRDLGSGLDLGPFGSRSGYGSDSSYGSSYGSSWSSSSSSSSGYGSGSGSSFSSDHGLGSDRDSGGRYGGSGTGRHSRDTSSTTTRWSDGSGGSGRYGSASQYGTATADTPLWERDRSTDTGQWDRFTDTTEWDRSELTRIDTDELEGRYWSDRDETFWSGTRLAEDDPRWVDTPASAPRSPAVAYPIVERESETRTDDDKEPGSDTDVRESRYGGASRTSTTTRTSTATQTGTTTRSSTTTRTGSATWSSRPTRSARRSSSSAIGSSRRRLEDDLLNPNPGGPLAAVLYSAAWYAVPVLVFLVWVLTLDPSAPPGCVTDVTGGGCESERARAMELVVNGAPRFGTALASSLVCAVIFRWWGSTWRAWSVGLAAAVVGGGLSTVLLSAITGQPIGG